MQTTRDILVISGLPGAGKTHYTDWLKKHGWGCLRSDDYDTMNDEQRLALDQTVRGVNDEALLSLSSEHHLGFVFEFGFLATDSVLDMVEGMINRGYNAWYLDGDRDAARESWTRRWPDRPLADWDTQADSLRALEERIHAIYGARIIRTVEAGPTYPLTPTQIQERIGLRSIE